MQTGFGKKLFLGCLLATGVIPAMAADQAMQPVGIIGAPAGTAETGWSTDLAAEEFKSLVPNLPLLQEIARRTGGRVVTQGELPALARELPSSPAPVMETITRPLWNTPIFFSLALAALLAEWGLRRWKGLP